MYPAYMQESIHKVEATREKRLKEVLDRRLIEFYIQKQKNLLVI